MAEQSFGPFLIVNKSSTKYTPPNLTDNSTDSSTANVTTGNPINPISPVNSKSSINSPPSPSPPTTPRKPRPRFNAFGVPTNPLVSVGSFGSLSNLEIDTSRPGTPTDLPSPLSNSGSNSRAGTPEPFSGSDQRNELQRSPSSSSNPTLISSKNYTESRISIDYQQFLSIYKNKDFLKGFQKSLIAFYKEKLDFYNSKTKEIFEEQKKSKQIFDELFRSDSNLTMKLIDPLYQTLTIIRSEMNFITKQISIALNGGFPLRDLENALDKCINDPQRGMSTLVGRSGIQDMLAGLLFSFSKDHRSFSKMFNNFAIYGPSGIGKTKVGAVIGWVLSQSLILVRDLFKVVTKADLVGQYVGATAPRTRGVLLSSLEGVLFIDEAYQLASSDRSASDFGAESITEIVNFLDKYIGVNVVIVAGYEEPMTQQFMTSNEGLSRRFPNVLVLRPYNDEELTNILIGFLTTRSSIELDQETNDYLLAVISQIRKDEPKMFDKQAGDMLNLSGFILRKVYSSFSAAWIPGNLDNNKILIAQAFNEFLASKRSVSRLQEEKPHDHTEIVYVGINAPI